jgi:hypothetical protein
MLPNHNIHKHTRTSPDGKNNNEIDHILTDRQGHSNVFVVQSIRVEDVETDSCLVVTKFKEKLAKQTANTIHIMSFSLKNLNVIECKEKYCDDSNRSTALKELDIGVELILPGKQSDRMSKFLPKRF